MHYLRNIYNRLKYKEYGEELSPIDLPVFFWDKEVNLGDLYNHDLFKYIFPERIIKVVGPNFNQTHLSGVGSILQLIGQKSVITGSGFISKNSYLVNQPKKIISVRGKLTSEKLKSAYDIDARSFGDMGLIADRIFKNVSKVKKFRFGIIPHYVDYDLILTKEFQSDNVLILDIRTNNTEQFLEQMNSCEFILSSSLHGLIFADAFGIPNQRIIMSNQIVGGDFKFADYFSSVKRELDETALRPSSLNDIKTNAKFSTGVINHQMLLDTIGQVQNEF